MRAVLASSFVLAFFGAVADAKLHSAVKRPASNVHSHVKGHKLGASSASKHSHTAPKNVTSSAHGKNSTSPHHGAGVSPNYGLVTSYQGSNFFDGWDFFTGPDPTNGFVQYVDQTTAQNAGYISAGSSNVYIGADHTNNAPNGRQSVRISTKQAFTHGLFVVDLGHMPVGCGTWPAFWTLETGATWPTNGEIDIIEGVNTLTTNAMTLHTQQGCTMAGDSRDMSGTVNTEDCWTGDPNQSNNAGCGVQATGTDTYGDGFNNAGGGVYAMEWQSTGIRMWHWQHSNVPSSLSNGSPDTTTFGQPLADFPNTNCNIDQFFSNHQIVFDLTFCGDYAGNVFTQQGCGSSCTDYVANNPNAFANAYWIVNSVKVYQ